MRDWLAAWRFIAGTTAGKFNRHSEEPPEYSFDKPGANGVGWLGNEDVTDADITKYFPGFTPNAVWDEDEQDWIEPDA